MRTRVILVVLLALLLVAGAVTAGFALTEKSAPRCNEETGRGCATTTECNPERPACQEQQRNARLRAFCAENPRDAKCRA